MAYTIENISYTSTNNVNTVNGKIFIPSDTKGIKGILQISHGMSEHINRYENFSKFLVENGYIVCGHDHIGHGTSVNSEQELGFFARENGYKYLIEDLHKMTQITKSKFKNVPYFLLGHSMGSFIARCYTQKYDYELDGLIIMGTGGKNKFTDMGIKLTELIISKKGPNYKSKIVEKLSTGSFNSYFKPNKSDNDWISTDEKTIEEYEKDKLCGFKFSVSAYKDLFNLSNIANDVKLTSNIKKELAIYIVSGGQDPVGDFGKGVESVHKLFKSSNHINTTLKIYPDSRHEVLNEVNRVEVYNDILNWLNLQINNM